MCTYTNTLYPQRYIRHVRLHELNRPSLQTAPLKRKLTNCTVMLLRTQNLDATDPRDKIFAVHGLLSVLGARLPDPDYSKSIEQVYREAATAAIVHDNGLHILASITGERLVGNLPSWVPDWSCNRTITKIASWEDYVELPETGGCFRISADGSRLTLWGLEVDKIQEHSVAFPAHYHQYSIRELTILLGWLELLEKDHQQKDPVDFFSGFIRKPWPRTKTSLNMLSVRVLSEYWIKVLRHFKAYPHTHRHERYSASDIGYCAARCAERDGLVATGENVRGDIQYFHKLMRTLLDRKVMFRTERGQLGIATRALQSSDRVVYFQGVSLPMLVRKAESNWRLVAPAYIQDGMLEHVSGMTHNNVLPSLRRRRELQRYVLV